MTGNKNHKIRLDAETRPVRNLLNDPEYKLLWEVLMQAVQDLKKSPVKSAEYASAKQFFEGPEYDLYKEIFCLSMTGQDIITAIGEKSTKQ